MSSDQRALYNAQLIALSRDTQARGTLEAPTGQAHLHNPLCGDSLHITWTLDPTTQRLTALRYEGYACAICMASAALMAQQLQGQPLAHAIAISHQRSAQLAAGDLDALPASLHALKAIKAAPSRYECARLPWGALLTTASS